MTETAESDADIATPTLVVLEREPFWEPELRRQFRTHNVAVRACRTLPDLDVRLRQYPGSAALVDLRVGSAEVLRWLARQMSDARPVAAILIAPEASLPVLEWHAREAGAVAVVSEFISGRELARLCHRQWRPSPGVPKLGAP